MKELKKYLQDLVDQHQIAGGALIIHKDGKELFHQSVGYADIKAKRPIRDDSIYRLMSMPMLCLTHLNVMLNVQSGASKI